MNIVYIIGGSIILGGMIGYISVKTARLLINKINSKTL